MELEEVAAEFLDEVVPVVSAGACALALAEVLPAPAAAAVAEESLIVEVEPTVFVAAERAPEASWRPLAKG